MPAAQVVVSASPMPASRMQAPSAAARDSRPAARLVLSAGVLMLIALAPLGAGLAGAVALYELSSRAHEALARHVKSGFAAVLLVCAVLILVATPLLWLGYTLATRLPSIVSVVEGLRIPDAVGTGLVRTYLAPLVAVVRNAVSGALPRVIPAVISTTGWALVNWSIALIGMYYLLASPGAAWRAVATALPLSASSVESLHLRLRDTTRAITAGTLLSCIVQGSSIGLGFYLGGIPEPLFWAFAGTLTTLLPFVSNAVIWLPAIAWTILTRQFGAAIAIGAFAGLAPPVIDRVVRATVSSRVGQVHPMVTLVGALAGIRIAGIAGLVFGPVALDLFLTLVDLYRREYAAVNE